MLNIDKLVALGLDASTLLQQQQIGCEMIRICERDGLRWVQTSGRSLLSAFELDDPANPVFPNHRSMLCALLLRKQPATVLNLGFGVGSFERYFHQHLPNTFIESVDTNSELVDLSRQWFRIPHDWPVIIAEAHVHLARSRRAFDLVLCDIFVNDAHPPCLFDANFYASAAQRLCADGVLALNLSPESNAELLRILLPVRKSFSHVMLATLSGHDNVVLVASREAFANISELRLKAQQKRDTPGLNLLDDIAQFTRLPQPES
jgi:spermidine synthase